MTVNEKPVGAVFDGYSRDVVSSGRIEIRRIYLHAGTNLFKFQVVGKNEAADDYRFGVDCLVLRRI